MSEAHEHDSMWDEIDCMVETMDIDRNILVRLIKVAIELEPQGAARRASGTPQYDLDRVAKGGDEQEQPAPEPQAPPEPYWPVDPSYTRPDTEPADPADFALANDCS